MSPQMQEALAAYKLALSQATDSIMETQRPSSPPDEIAKRLAQGLSAGGITADPSRKLFVEAIPVAPDRLVVSETYSTPCGDGSLLLMYRRISDGWNNLANRNDDTAGNEFGRILGLYAVNWTHSDASVVVARASSACGASSHSIVISAYSTSDGKAERGELWAVGVSVRTSTQAEFRVDQEGFTLRARMESQDHPDTGVERTITYRVDKDGAHRRLSLDAPPADLFTEWVNMPWHDARTYALRAAARPLEGLHWRLNKSDTLIPKLQPYSLQQVRTCTDTPTHREITLDLRPNDSKMQESAYMEVDTTFSDAPFRFAFAVADPACENGSVLLEQRQ